MSAIRPEDFMRFFEKTTGVRAVDAHTRRPALEVMQEEDKTHYDRWLAAQDEATRLEHKMGAF